VVTSRRFIKQAPGDNAVHSGGAAGERASYA
jgi:hypothetical protein